MYNWPIFAIAAIKGWHIRTTTQNLIYKFVNNNTASGKIMNSSEYSVDSNNERRQVNEKYLELEGWEDVKGGRWD